MKSKEMVNCPYCGESLPKRAKACPHCGSDEKTGWSEYTYMDGINTSMDDGEYEDLYQSEFSSEKSQKSKKQIIIGIGLLVLFVLLVLRSFIA